MRLPAELTITTLRQRVGYVDTDQGGVMHHATYLRYLEFARIEHMRALGLEYKQLELDHKLALPVAETRVRYKLPARFDDELELKTWIAVANRAKVRFDSLVMRGQDVLTHAEITLACIRLPEGKLCSMPAVILNLADEPIRGKL